MKVFKEGASFGVAGLIQLAIDWLVFVSLTKLGVIASAANLTGRICGALFGFWLNGKWVFRRENGDDLSSRHLGRYALWWTTTALVSTATVSMVAHLIGVEAAWAAKPVIDILLAGCSFLVSKFWIYR